MTDLLFLCGSLRKQSSSRALVTALINRLGNDCDATIANISELPHFNSDIESDKQVSEFRAQLSSAQGVVIVTPEYNYSVPGFLKNAIDWASRPALQSVFRGKPVFVITVSAGALGGVRAQSHLKYILNGMLAEVFSAPEIVVARSNAVVENGVFNDETTLNFAVENLRVFLDHLQSKSDTSS